MLRYRFLLFSVILLSILTSVHARAVHAAADAVCTTEPTTGLIGTVFTITCSGFDANTYVYPYTVEPDGTAVAGSVNGVPGGRTDSSGSITFTFPTRYENFTQAIGTWTVAVEQLGPGHAVIHRGITRFTVGGGTEGVSGAALSANPSTVKKPSQAYTHQNIDGIVTLNDFAVTTTNLSGSGFQPYEYVSFWADYPRSECSSFTVHYNEDAELIEPPIFVARVTDQYNVPAIIGIGTFALTTVKADASGNVSLDIGFFSYDCEGAWHIVARGVSSGRGGDTYVTLVGNPITATVSLIASPNIASAMFDRITFTGSGYASNEHISCWLTTPEGQVVGVPNDLFVSVNLGFFVDRSIGLAADSAGHVSFQFETGSFYDNVHQQTSGVGGSSDSHGEFFDPFQSEGALGVWAMTCRGDTSGAIGIADFTLTGGVVDP